LDHATIPCSVGYTVVIAAYTVFRIEVSIVRAQSSLIIKRSGS
jgi:hypothetical protein